MHFGAVHGAIAAKLPPPILPRQPGSALALLTVCRLALSSAHPAAAYKRGRAPLGYRIPAQATVRQVMPDAGQVHCQPVAAEVLASTSEPAPDDCGSIIVDHFSDEQMWIFGFGSLIHNQGFDWTRRVDGFIRGYRRVFYQGSTDHRGVPGAPGRTATLIRDAGAVTWGSAFCLAGTLEEQAATLKYLEFREKQYDIREHVDIFVAEGGPEPAVTRALLYIASDDRTRNENWLGPAPLEELAAQIATAQGPSGPNCEYVFRLADAIREMGNHDPELFELEAAIRAHQETVVASKSTGGQ